MWMWIVTTRTVQFNVASIWSWYRTGACIQVQILHVCPPISAWLICRYMYRSSQHSWWSLVLAKMHPAHWVTVYHLCRPKGHLRSRELWFSIYSCAVHVHVCTQVIQQHLLPTGMCEFGGDLAPTVECTELFIISAYGMGLYPDVMETFGQRKTHGGYLAIKILMAHTCISKLKW